MKLEIRNITKSFGDAEILHGISFEVESGKALGLLGRNGAGKTTTIRIIMDVFKSNGGDIYIDGKPFVPASYKIGYLPEERGLYPKKTVIEQMIYLGRLKGLTKTEAKKSAKYWMDKIEIAEYENRKLETLSKGNQQKVQLAATLVCNPEIVILDEPFSGLDPVNSQILKDIVNQLIEEGRIVIFSSHQMSYVEEFCDSIVIIDKGEVALKGSLKDIKKQYGKDRLILSAENYNLEELDQKIRMEFSELVTTHSIKKDFLVLELLQNSRKSDFVQEIIRSNIDIAHFGIYEPSLNDIFVARVGEAE